MYRVDQKRYINLLDYTAIIEDKINHFTEEIGVPS